MNGLSQYNPINIVSLHFEDGSVRLYKREELMKLISDLSLDRPLIFAVVNYINRATPMIIRNVQEIYNYFGLKY